MSKSFSNIAKFVKTNRESSGLSQRELCEKLGYKESQFVSNIERALCGIPLKKLNSLVEALGVDKDKIKIALMSDYESDLVRSLK